ncbi:Hypothetical_protein [Hexamita inflata]|uniref:Hypothetical_protein n=1 Tax=Hexamita inflata TaxID=28002 RepID=A0AA86UKU7_9EUKA|nr:Hypothetical protein HINF_LOCUS36104 [Hexamita inflata]CAI9953260.1 Hypothetical protein HINF_LOCUS40905 [Hexamita inflata]CAI9959679.1 Hypothetical protein HINF_LOCUS47324 [Hexamita inflata]
MQPNLQYNQNAQPVQPVMQQQSNMYQQPNSQNVQQLNQPVLQTAYVQQAPVVMTSQQAVYPAATNTTVIVNSNNNAASAAADAAVTCLCWYAFCRIFCCCLECLLHLI